jgi:hypothetical protein
MRPVGVIQNVDWPLPAGGVSLNDTLGAAIIYKPAPAADRYILVFHLYADLDHDPVARLVVTRLVEFSP